MSNLLDAISAAEEQAAQIRSEGALFARRRIAEEQAQSEEAQKAVEAELRAAREQALAAAEAEGSALESDILKEYDQSNEALRAEAETRIPDALSYLMERIAAQ